MLSRRPIARCALFVLLLAAAGAAGCGKKGDPVPPRLLLPPAIAGLAADSVPEGILLGWSATGPVGGIDHFRIVRGEASREEACPGCPQEYRPLATPKISDPALRRAGAGAFGYLDRAVTEDRFYSYRVSACDSRGRCGEPSASAGLLKGKPGAGTGK